MKTEFNNNKKEALNKTDVSSIFDDDAELDFYLQNQPILTKEGEQEQMDRINKGCDLIKKMGLSANIPEPN